MSQPDELIARLRGARCLVTGGAGFIGSHLVEGLVAAGAGEVVVADDLSLGRVENLVRMADVVDIHVIDVGDLPALEQLCDGRAFDLCFNLAVMPLPHCLEHPRENVDRNVAMTTAVCELARAGGIGRLVQFSSSEVYGTAMTAPMPESHSLRAHTPYAAAKAATDLVALSYATTFDIDATVVRPFNAYGERQNDMAYAGLIPIVVRAVEAGEPITINGDGEQSRDMTHVSDIVRGTLAIAAADGLTGEVFNLGHGTEATVNAMVEALLDAMSARDHPVVHGPPRPGDVRRLLADTSAARSAVGYEPLLSIGEGFERTVSWYLQTSLIGRDAPDPLSRRAPAAPC